ncbi:MAG TPA: DUF1854 domain-containing protein [Clostridia bacterium]|jgi:hypothetical protein|nr:DUF1854 domain-containing protein [Clostridia bacterium]MDD4501864.1 DUF1854 domain-containing protein [Clostridia bacterium]NLV34613.1 DUF1854 domain-containing protein [Clostridiaceae bacterium]HQM95812.1 DUF1854 domain-containing protein [Clostridia bacterium]HQO68855.1 DUF1854 domain-containing protein [Clostridia bacterium]
MKVPYIEGDNAKIERVDLTHMNVIMFDGQKFDNVEPRRLFPISGLRKYITLLDNDEKEVAIIRNLDSLMDDSKKAVEQCLNEYYLIPKITKVYEVKEVSGNINMHVLTDKGERKFEIWHRYNDIKIIHGTRMLFRDMADNRYEIEDIDKLDKSSRIKLGTFI